ncbi:MAG: hypothetical protein WC133_06135 [Candidatus Omnitrophota bacterium]
MNKKYLQASNLFIGVGVILPVVGGLIINALMTLAHKNDVLRVADFAMGEPDRNSAIAMWMHGSVYLSLWLIAFISCVWGMCLYAKSKGRSMWWGLLGLVYLLGWVILYALPDKTITNELPEKPFSYRQRFGSLLISFLILIISFSLGLWVGVELKGMLPLAIHAVLFGACFISGIIALVSCGVFILRILFRY